MKLTNQQLHDKLLDECKNYPHDWLCHHVAYNQKRDLSIDFSTIAWMHGRGMYEGPIELIGEEGNRQIISNDIVYDLFILTPTRV